MRLCRFADSRLGVVQDGEVIDVSECLGALPEVRWPVPRGDMLIAALPSLRPEIERLAKTGKRVPLASLELQSPVANPGKIVAAPVNYRLHLEESRADPGIHFGSHVNTIWRSFIGGTNLARWDAQPSAPLSTSGSPKRALVEAITMSQLPTRPTPRPMQKSLTAAMTGTGVR